MGGSRGNIVVVDLHFVAAASGQPAVLVSIIYNIYTNVSDDYTGKNGV